MNINFITINNYKSIGSERNTLFLDSGTTAIIGKNESGKSNVLEAIGNLPYFNKPNPSYYYNKNRSSSSDDCISIVFSFQMTKKEVEKYYAKQSQTEILFTDKPTAIMGGALSEIISNDTELHANIETLVKTKGNFNIWNIRNNEINKKKHAFIIDSLNKCSEVLLLNFKKEISSLKQLLLRSSQEFEELSNTIENIRFSLSNYYKLFPKILYREHDRQLNYSYDYETIKEILQTKDNIFYNLLLAAEIEEQDILQAFEEKSEGYKQNIRFEIEDKIKRNIGEKFNEFYTQEKVRFIPRFEGNTLKFFINTNSGKMMQITERSNGLRWYMGLFIDILAADIGDSQVLFLFDEPGVHLHINAQKELLSLFEDLSKKGHQVIYTTHLPSMLDGENILNVRVVEKDYNGNTLIYKNSYDQRLSTESKMETLSPLIKAIGADLKFSLGPQSTKLNIITEGITDYMYIKAFINYLNIDTPPYIIPSAGVENINKIVSILLGWGCDFKVILDYDMAGRKEYTVLTQKLDSSLKNKIIFINGKNQPCLEEIKNSPTRIEDLISNEDFKKLSNIFTEQNKVLLAKEFYDKVLDGTIKPEPQTVENFKVLFRKLGLVVEKQMSKEVLN